jgi:Ca2+-binding EF-hand superfamily protein
MKTILITSSAFLLASCASTTNPGQEAFKKMDFNRDQRVSSEEFHAHVTSEGFRQLDSNGDEKLTREEWLLKETAPDSEELFLVLDINNDGVVTVTEFSESQKKRDHINRIFETVDRNKDGSLGWDEVQTPIDGF